MVPMSRTCAIAWMVLLHQQADVRRLLDSTNPVAADLGADAVETEAARLVELGAERLEPGRGWIVLRDPVGMVFCVTGNSPDDP